MKYNDSLGAISDTIQYFTFYFNENAIIESIKNFSNDVNHDMQFYYFIKNKNIVISEFLQPFFYYDGQVKPFINQLIYDVIHDVSFEKCIEIITDTKNIKKRFINYYFGECDNYEKDAIYASEELKIIFDFVKRLSLPHEMLFRLQNMLQDFQGTIDLLADSFNKIHEAVKEMRNTNYSLIDSVIRNVYSHQSKNLLVRFFDKENLDYNKIVCAVDLINSHNILFNDSYILILGFNYISYGKRLYLYDNVTLHTFGKIYSDETRYRILEMFYEKPEITMSEICELMDMSQQAVHKHVTLLRDEMMIYVSRKRGREMYLTLNFEYFHNFQLKYSEFMGKVSKGAESAAPEIIVDEVPEDEK